MTFFDLRDLLNANIRLAHHWEALVRHWRRVQGIGKDHQRFSKGISMEGQWDGNAEGETGD